MKKSYIILAAVPVVCALGGFGAGTFLKGNEVEHAVPHGVAPKTPAEGVLHTLADEIDTHGTDHGASQIIHIEPTHTDSAHGEQHSSLIPAARIIPAAYTGAEEEKHDEPVHVASTEPHRLDPDKLAAHANQVMLERTREERRKALEAKLNKIEATIDQSRKNPALLPVEVEAQITEDAIKRIAASEDHVVRLGRLTLPVKGAAKTTYYVADFGVAVTDLDQAAYYYEGQNAARLRDQVMVTLHQLAPTQILRSDRVDSDQLAARVTQDLQKFSGIEEFIFLSLYKTDIPLS